jgi:TPP-dependent pyruvate/acetoin dehydrogenase alpha subunit
MTTALAAPSLRSSREPDPRLVGSPSETRNRRLYRRMRFIRRFEEVLLGLFEEGLLNGTTHACIGQEANAVALVEHLVPGDHLFSNHRCHGHFLAWTGDAFGLLAEITGDARGVCRGIGGSQHLCAPGFKSNGVLGGILPAAAGIAFAEQLRGSDGLSVVFIGDGTLGEGVVYETLNLAALWQLPLLVVLEHNGWSQSTPSFLSLAGSIVDRFTAFGISAVEVDSTDVLEVERAAAQAVSSCRAERAPGVLVIYTYRLCHHSKSDDDRPREEVEARWLLEPLAVHGRRLEPAERRQVDDEVEAALRELLAAIRAG